MPRRTFLKTTTAAILFAVVLSSVVLAKDTPKERTPQPRTTASMPFAPSEVLIYEGEFSKLLLRGINIAELKFKASRPQAVASGVAAEGEGSAPVAEQPLLLTTDVVSKGFFSKLFGVTFKFHAESQVEPNDFYAMRTSKVDEQGKRVRTSEAVFDQDAKTVEYTERDPNNTQQPPRIVTAALAGPTQDIVSAVYFMRTQPLMPGQTFNIAISDSGRVFQVPAQVFAEDKKMKSVVGKVSVVRVEVELFGPGRPVEEGKGKMFIWVTNDERHLPIKARLSHEVGQLDITLKSIQRDEPQVASR